MEGKVIKKIGTYTVYQQLLGKGSFSSVFFAHDQFLKPLAAKVISLSLLESTYFFI
jgi:hypothetical protein